MISIAARAKSCHATRWLPALFVAVAAAFLYVGIASAADLSLQGVRERLDNIRDVFDSAENTIKQSSLRDSDFTSLRDTINPLRAEIRTIIGDLEPRHGEAEKRLKELGPAPKEDTPAEDARITVERGTQTSLLADIDSALKQAKLLGVRGDQLSAKIDDARRSRFKERLFTRTESILSPSLWLSAMKALPDEARGLKDLTSEGNAYALMNTATGTMLLAPIAILALTAAVIFLRRLLLRRIDRSAANGEVLQNHRSRAAYLAICRAAINGATPPLTAIAAIDILSAFNLVSPRLDQLTSGVLVAIAYFSVGCAVTSAMVTPARKMIGFDETASHKLYSSLAGAVTAIAIATLLFTFHRVLGAPAGIRELTSALMALLVAIFVVRILLIKSRPGGGEKSDGLPNLIRLVGWLAAAAILIALAIGHINFATFLAARLVDAAIICGAAVLILSLIDSVFAAGFTEEGSRRRKVASAIGINPARLDLLATIMAGVLRTLLLVVALFLVVGGWRNSVTDVASTFDNFDLAVTIGQSRLALGSLLEALGVLIVGLIATRIVHRWLNHSVLPRSGLDTGLQNSIATMVVYLGVIAAGLLALAQIGINLQNIAFVAGALSVGIGFGLQSVVSNFVSGIILLAERPIRIGDIISVKGEQGYVRRISVRATEIETADRSNVIVPNSELISNVLTNWTHSNTLGRITLKVGVSYDADPKKVREILLNAATSHPQVVKSPAPAVLLTGFGDYALEFQLFCVVGNVDTSGGVKSDLYFRILEDFRAAHIEIPIPQQEYRIRGEAGIKS